MLVDPKVYALAELFIDDLPLELSDEMTQVFRANRINLIQRAAEAMQQAIEDECEAIRQELTT